MTYTKFDFKDWNISDHYMTTRIDRHVAIATNGGYGQYIVLTAPRMDGKVECLTNSGILIILTQRPGKNGKRDMVTAFPPDVNKVFAMFKSAGIEEIPHWMEEKIVGWEFLRKQQNKGKPKSAFTKRYKYSNEILGR